MLFTQFNVDGQSDEPLESISNFFTPTELKDGKEKADAQQNGLDNNTPMTIDLLKETHEEDSSGIESRPLSALSKSLSTSTPDVQISHSIDQDEKIMHLISRSNCFLSTVNEEVISNCM